MPSEGFTVKVTVDEGSIAICGSRLLQCPDCSFSPSYDWKLEIEFFSEVYINGNGNPNDDLQSISKRQTVEMTNITVFITIEGLNSQNSFNLNTTFGDSTTPEADGNGMLTKAMICS